MVRKAAGMIISITVQIIICVLVVILIYNGAVKGFEFGISIFSSAAMTEAPGQDMIVIIEEGASAWDVGNLLEKKGLIQDEKIFFIQAILYKANLQAGTYTLNTSMTPEQILEILIEEPETRGE